MCTTPVARVHDSRNADDGAVERVLRDAGGLDERARSSADRIERCVDVDSVQLHILPSADGAAEVADRASEEPCAEVEAEHEGGVRHRLEEDGPVARPARIMVDLAHESGVEQRLQRERDGRLGDPGAAGDLRPRDRRACADRLEYRPLVELLQERRDRRASRRRARGHLVNDLNAIKRTMRLDSAERCRHKLRFRKGY